MILVSEHGRVREIESPLDAKTRAAREDFRRDIEDQFYLGTFGPREVVVAEGVMERPRTMSRRNVSRGICDLLSPRSAT